MKKILDEKIAGFYTFWAWEYTKRNRLFIERSGKALGGQPPRQDWGGRNEPDEEEYNAVERDFGFAPDFSMCCKSYSSEDMLEANLAGEEIVRPEGYRASIKSAPLRVLGLSSRKRKGVSCNGISVDSAHLVVEIDFDYSFDMIISSIKSIYDDYHRDVDFERSRERLEREQRFKYVRDKNTRNYIVEVLDCFRPSACIEMDYSDGTLEAYVKAIKENKRIQFDPEKELPRIIGLWLWDFCKLNNVGLLIALKELQGLDRLSEVDRGKDDRHFRRLYNRTSICINEAEVLSLREE